MRRSPFPLRTPPAWKTESTEKTGPGSASVQRRVLNTGPVCFALIKTALFFQFHCFVYRREMEGRLVFMTVQCNKVKFIHIYFPFYHNSKRQQNTPFLDF